jgi:hypothetical protein
MQCFAFMLLRLQEEYVHWLEGVKTFVGSS